MIDLQPGTDSSPPPEALRNKLLKELCRPGPL